MNDLKAPQSKQQPAIRLLAYDHIGIRVSHRQRAIDFYTALGFQQTLDLPEHQANEMLSADGVRINLIFNGADCLAGKNILLDFPIKYAGLTHPAFVVDDLAALQDWLNHQHIRITQGPHAIGPRRITLFIRDPDGNVLEFNQLTNHSI